MPGKRTIDHDLVIRVYHETDCNQRETAKRLGIHDNTVQEIRRRAEGKCIRCARPLDDSAYLQCSACREYGASFAKQRRVRQKANGICIQCEQPIAPGGESYCVHHMEQMRAKGTVQRKRDRERMGEDAYLERLRRRNRKLIYGDAAVEIFDEHDGSCALCGKEYSKRGIHIHHIDGDHGNQTKENMIPLCVRCHKLVHELLYHPNPALVLAWAKSTYALDI